MKDGWNGIYKTTRVLTVIMLVLIPIQILVFMLTDHPQDVNAWFSLFNRNPFLGLLHMDLLYLVNNIILGFIYLSIFFSLYESDRNLATSMLLLGMIGLVSYIPSNKAVEMFFLAREYAAADEPMRGLLSASAVTLLLEWKGTAYVTYYFLDAIALFLIAAAMFRSSTYSRAIASWALASAVFMTIPANFGTIGLIFSLLSLIPWYVFCVLFVRHLPRSTSGSPSQLPE